MKPKNFPARKLRRQIKADIRNGIRKANVDYTVELIQARDIRTKKRRS